ncbi:hypothetical protein [Dietzia sp. CH92]|uniref:hypothetical protein n=1 Tax=Dietzia sp. CH92 TaxID=3051823 RepID=UPI0028D3FA47|nr:hypothetical protein [Dietzia sp. CH92]
MQFPIYHGPVSGPLSGVTAQLVEAVAGFYQNNPVIDGILRIPALVVNGYATGSANFGF